MADKTQELRAALEKIVKQEGAACLKDVGKFRGLWMDYAPEGKESKLILSAVQEGIGSALLKAIDQDSTAQQQCLKRCIQRLTDAYIVEDGAKFAVQKIASALGIDAEKLMPAPSGQQETAAARPVSPLRAQPAPEKGKAAPEGNADIKAPAEAAEIVSKHSSLEEQTTSEKKKTRKKRR